MRQIQHRRRRYTFGQSFKSEEEGKQRKVINVQTRKPIDIMHTIRKMAPWAVIAGIIYFIVDSYFFS